MWVIGCGGRIWTYDLQVMSLTSYRAAPSRDSWPSLVCLVCVFHRLRVLTWILLGLAVSYSPTPWDAVPLPQQCLTSGFGMGPGVSLALWPPNREKSIHLRWMDLAAGRVFAEQMPVAAPELCQAGCSSSSKKINQHRGLCFQSLTRCPCLYSVGVCMLLFWFQFFFYWIKSSLSDH